MFKKVFAIVSLSAACLFAGQSVAGNSWSNGVGGDFNVPPKEYNKKYHGYGSTGQTIYNKIDLQTGAHMFITGGKLYDNQGNAIGTVENSIIGAINEGAGGRDGGIIAGAITKLKINGRNQEVIYAWSVNIKEGGRKSGWVKSKYFSPKGDIKDILKKNKATRLDLIESSLKKGSYVKKVIKAAYLPNEAAEWYLMPGRDGNAGKAKYYFTREGQISGLKNIPETGSQRYGVAHDTAPVGAVFYKDRNVKTVKTKIYKPNATSPSGYTLDLVWGYFVNSAGKKWYSWVNEKAL